MKKQLHCLILILIVIVIASGCKKDAVPKPVEQSKIVQGEIAGVNAPTGGGINQALKFDVVSQNADTTIRFAHLFDSVVHNNTHIIKLFNRTNVTDTAGRNNNITYVFKASKPGTYYIKFYKPDNSDKTAIIDTLVIK